jgi:hypothetical protein
VTEKGTIKLVARQFDPEKGRKILALVLGSPKAGERASARRALILMLNAYGIAGHELLPHHYLDGGDAAVVEQVNDLLHPLWTADDAAAREEHRVLIEQRLVRYRLSWSDVTGLHGLLKAGNSDAAAWRWLLDDTGTALIVSEQVSISILDQVAYLIAQYLALEKDQLTVVTLWVAHTHIYWCYMCSPRLAVCGPMNNLGKTTVFDVLSRLVLRPWRAATATEASLYSETDGNHITMLIDEMHNADLSGRRAAILHSGYRKGTPVRLARGPIDLFCAAAFGFIGSILTAELQSRALFIQMKRHDNSYPLRRFDFADTDDLDATYQHLCDFAANVKLDRDPELPPELLRDSRWADNARPLVAIADIAGGRWGEAARKALINLIVLHQSEHPNAILVNHLHEIFAERGYPNAMWSADLVSILRAREDGPWSEFCGLAGNKQPRPLRQTDLATMLHQFNVRIRPRSVRIGQTTLKGYYLDHLEPQFKAYCANYKPRQSKAAE